MLIDLLATLYVTNKTNIKQTSNEMFERLYYQTIEYKKKLPIKTGLLLFSTSAQKIWWDIKSTFELPRLNTLDAGFCFFLKKHFVIQLPEKRYLGRLHLVQSATGSSKFQSLRFHYG